MALNFDIKHQESYSRGQLLLRTFFGVFYIALPHLFLLMFVQLWGAILGFLAFWVVLFTGKYPRGWFDFQVNSMRWGARVNASLSNLTDEYPAFGLSASTGAVTLQVDYPESLSRGTLLLKAFFGVFYVFIPHGICLLFRSLWAAILQMLAWFVVLFTGGFPANWHAFIVGTSRWSLRMSLYMGNMSDEYPKFSGKP